MVLPPEGTLRAAVRWMCALRKSTGSQALALFRAAPQYCDLSTTQYMSGLEWIKGAGVVSDDKYGVVLNERYRALSETAARRILLERCFEMYQPPWIADADALVRDRGDLPQDALEMATAFGVPEWDTWVTVRQVHGKIDLAERQRIGSLGEVALVGLLEASWPGATEHVAKSNDGFGYDVALTLPTAAWHLEVKTTSRRGRLVVHLSRHEYEVGRRDPAWRLVVVGLNQADCAAALATVDFAQVRARIPTDVSALAAWQSVRLELLPMDLRPGLAFLSDYKNHRGPELLLHGTDYGQQPFAWMPRAVRTTVGQHR